MECEHSWVENFDVGGHYCHKCGESKEDTYDYVKGIMENYSPKEARRRINGFLHRDIDCN